MRDDDIYRFLDTLSHRAANPGTRYVSIAACVPRVRAGTDARAGEALSIETVRAWLKRDAARSPFANVVQPRGHHRALP